MCQKYDIRAIALVSVIIVKSWNIEGLRPVVQSIISLTTSLRHQLVKYMGTIHYQKCNYFCWKNVRIFYSAKESHIFSSPVQSTGRAIVLTLASALALALVLPLALPLALPFPSRHF